ncbi:alpha/beta hydrolase [Chitinasiproducens palmae]|nr:alpha/beta hydrolase [Chitinasiproducens palmae]
MYVPEGDGPFPLVIEVHGGAWCRGSRVDDHNLNVGLASRGVVVAAIDFTMPPDGAYPASFHDINFAVRWFKESAWRWRSQANLVGLLGVSSGGHQAVLSALCASDGRYAQSPLPGSTDIDARVAFVIACWPVIDPLGRYRYAKSLQAAGSDYPEAIDRVIPDQEKYWGSEEAMGEGAPATALERGDELDLPPLLCIQGGEDIVHPRAQLDRFLESYRRAGGDARLSLYVGEAESFITRRPDAEATARAIQEIGDYVLTRGRAVRAA